MMTQKLQKQTMGEEICQALSDNSQADLSPLNKSLSKQWLPSNKLSQLQQQLRSTFRDTLTLTAHFCTKSLAYRRVERCLPTLYECTSTAYPTLVDIKMSHGCGTAISLLGETIIQFCESLNLDKVPNEEQASEMAELIYEEAYYLNLLELHEFFKRLRKGVYGGFFGSIDSCKVIEKLALFLVDRQKIIQRIKLDKEEQKRIEVARVIATTPAAPMPESLKQLIAEVDFSIPKPVKSEMFSHACPECGTQVEGLEDHIWCYKCNYVGSPQR